MNLVPYVRFDNLTNKDIVGVFESWIFTSTLPTTSTLRYNPVYNFNNGGFDSFGSVVISEGKLLVKGTHSPSDGVAKSIVGLIVNQIRGIEEKFLGSDEEKFYISIRGEKCNTETIEYNENVAYGVNNQQFHRGTDSLISRDKILNASFFVSLRDTSNKWDGTWMHITPYVSFANYSTVYILIDQIIYVSLSKVFGLGNEPDLAWCQENITYENLIGEKEEPIMSKLVWDADTERRYETGVDHGVLYTKDSDGKYSNGVAWNGLTGVTQSPSGSEPTALWADNIKYLSIKSAEEFGCTIEAYTYPPEFNACNGMAELATGISVGQQKRASFGFCYRSILGNDAKGESYGYKLHLIYGCEASPSESAYSTVNDSPDAITFSWTVTTTPVAAGGSLKPTALLEIDSTEVDATKLAQLEEILYGKNGTGESDPGVAPRLPLPSEIATIFAAG